MIIMSFHPVVVPIYLTFDQNAIILVEINSC
jgi:hypothetical protein